MSQVALISTDPKNISFSDTLTERLLLTLDYITAPEYHRVPAEDLLGNTWRIEQYRPYHELRRMFSDLCLRHRIPHNCAAAFWQQYLEQDDIPEDDSVALLLGAASSYGDCFQHAIVNSLPKGFLSIDDPLFMKLNVPSVQRRALERYEFSAKELVLSEKNSNLLFDALRQNTMNASEYNEWVKSFEKYCTGKNTPNQHIEFAPLAKDLAAVFHEMVELLSGYKNSQIKGFREAWGNFCSGDCSGFLYQNMEQLAYDILSTKCLQDAAPAFVSLVFKRFVSSLFSSEVSPDHAKKIFPGLSSRQRNDYKLNAQSNNTAPRRALLITYQLLKRLFHSKSSTKPGDKHYPRFNEPLCDYIIACFINCADMKHFTVTDEQFKCILSHGTVAENAFSESEEPVHPLMSMFDERLNFSLILSDDTFPCLFPEESGGSLPSGVSPKDVEKLVDEDAVTAYRSIMIDNAYGSGIGSRYLNSATKHALAELLDHQLSVSKSSALQRAVKKWADASFDIRVREMSAIERAFQIVCSKKIVESVRRKVLAHLFQAFYSGRVVSLPGFLHDKTADGSEAYYQIIDYHSVPIVFHEDGMPLCASLKLQHEREQIILTVVCSAGGTWSYHVQRDGTEKQDYPSLLALRKDDKRLVEPVNQVRINLLMELDVILEEALRSGVSSQKVEHLRYIPLRHFR